MRKALLFVFLVPIVIQAQLPFTVEATEDAAPNFPGAPHLSSTSFGQWEGKWVFIGGRIAGYHSVGGGSAEFLRADTNREVWVVDTGQHPAKTYHAEVSQLPASLAIVKEEWTSTGQLSYQDGRFLYVGGGYGQNSAGKWVTFDVLTKVDLPRLINGVIHGEVPGEAVSFTSSPAVQSTGGELTKLSDGFFYLAMGHRFMGSYTAFEGGGEHNTEAASQTYLNEIRKLKISSDSAGRLIVSLVASFCNEAEFHRRDLNVVKIAHAGGDGLAVFGGVFTPDTQLSYSKPIYLLAGGKPMVERSFEQKMNAYVCSRLALYDKASNKMYTTLLGGISRYAWDDTTHEFRANPRVGTKTEPTYLDGLQWSDRISTLQTVIADGKMSTTEAIQPKALPVFVGTDAVFIPEQKLARAMPDTDIIDLNALPAGKTFVGYLYGGIQAFPFQFPYTRTAAPYNSGAVPSRPSELILKVYVQR
jgi:hypothetical protein